MSPRAEIVTVARELLRLGLVAGTSGNVSAREGDLIHITPSAMAYADMTAEDLVTLSGTGEVVEGRHEPSSERRVHLAVYEARPDVAAIVHTHSVHATAWSYLDELLETDTEEIEEYAGGAIRTAPYAPTGGDAIARHAVEALSGRRAALMARHGVLAVGATPAEALVTSQVVERQAQLALLLREASS